MKGNYTIILLMFGKFLVECPLTFGGSHIGLLLHGAGGHSISLPQIVGKWNKMDDGNDTILLSI